MSTSKSRDIITRIGSYGVIRDSNNILLCRLSSEVRTHQGWWTLPGGGLEFGEHPEEGMIREVMEETGFLVKPTGLLGIHSFSIEADEEDFHGIQIVYSAQIVGGQLQHEQEGTTDLCQWHDQALLSQLTIVPLIEKAMEYEDR